MTSVAVWRVMRYVWLRLKYKKKKARRRLTNVVYMFHNHYHLFSLEIFPSSFFRCRWMMIYHSIETVIANVTCWEQSTRITWNLFSKVNKKKKETKVHQILGFLHSWLSFFLPLSLFVLDNSILFDFVFYSSSSYCFISCFIFTWLFVFSVLIFIPVDCSYSSVYLFFSYLFNRT